MSKVFRLYKEGAAVNGWNENPAFPYNSNARATIADPDGASAKNEITSIPSPFARIDLVKTAFKEVCRRANGNLKALDGKTIFHKMVSDTLDVGEIFFNIDKLGDKVEIITCDCAAVLQNLKSDGNASHYYVADSLDKFLLSDAGTYNFDKMNNLYLLNYTNGLDVLNIIGATSPATLFFCGANKLDYINDIFFADNDKPFDDEYQPLYKRDFEYLKAWWVLSKTNPNFSSLFPEIDEYLQLTFKAITDMSKKGQLKAITAELTLSDFSTIDVKSNGLTDQVEVLGMNLLKKKSGVMNSTSEFTIKPAFDELTELPLVLPVEAGNKYAALNYVCGAWGKSNKAPYIDMEDVTKRHLPFDGSKFAYLTISDILEDTIVKVPHALNKQYFFDGNLDESREMETFLLPIKPLYFKYFSVDDLQSKMPDGKSAFEMQSIAGGSVNVVIRIPIIGNDQISYIEYERMYYTGRHANVSAEENDGGMASFDFTGLVMPCVKFQDDAEALYTVSCVSTFSNQFGFKFYKGETAIQNVPVDCRNKQKGLYDYKAETYTVGHSNFDFIQVSNPMGVKSILVPMFPEHQSLDAFEFAVDLGTSNTHIEFKKAGDNTSTPFLITDSEPMRTTFFVPTYREVEGKLMIADLHLKPENDLMDADYIPAQVGDNSDFSFPTRTTLSYAKAMDWSQVQRTFGLLNFNLTYNKRSSLKYNAAPLVNIKWSNESNAQAAMQAFIRNVMVLIRNKVVANNGNLSQSKITWFYPNSMSPRRLAQLREAWNQAYIELFNHDGVTNNVSESVAPIQYYFKRFATATNLVNVDIGGGTTDIAFSTGGHVDYITSFKFAANSLFEDSFSPINPNNGIIDYFKGEILELLSSKSESDLNELVNIFKDNDGHPSDMASFLFSLKGNSATKGLAQEKIDFNKVLQNDEKFKIVFIVFYSAIIYHIAQIVKVKGGNVPRHIAFSGNGSKILSVLSSDKSILSRYTKVIFEKVLGHKVDTALEILGLEGGANPKEATCKGGLVASADLGEAPDILVLKDSFGSLLSPADTYLSVTDSFKQEVIDGVKHFFNLILNEIPSVFNLNDNFGVDDDSLEIARQTYADDLETYLDKGIALSVEESGSVKNPIEDALLFYPIKGFIQTLSSNINEHNK